MIKKTVTYKDFTGEEQTEDFYFHLTEADVIELEVSANGNSLSAWTEKIVKAQNGAEIISAFKKILDASYGVKSDDQRRFIKNAENLAEFKSTNAYSKLFMELATNAEVASVFVNGIMPEGMPEANKSVAAMSPEAARKASEANMQGHRKAEQKPVATMERQPDLPVVLDTAPPVLAPTPTGEHELPPVVPQNTMQDINSMSAEQLRELVSRQGGFPKDAIQ